MFTAINAARIKPRLPPSQEANRLAAPTRPKRDESHTDKATPAKPPPTAPANRPTLPRLLPRTEPAKMQTPVSRQTRKKNRMSL